MKWSQILTVVGLLLLPAAAVAQTPDGVPPSRETICDPLRGPGPAFGLCNAYCEAMDCDSPEAKASPKACSRVEANFTRLTGLTLPCLAQPACPCAEVEDSLFADFVDGTLAIDSCSAASDVGFSFVRVSSGLFDAEAASGEGGIGLCAVEVEGDAVEELLITAEEAAICIDLLTQAAANQGVDCVEG